MLDRILKLLQKRDIRGQELARVLGLNTSAISDWESGRSKSYKKHTDKIANYFDLSTDYLLGLTADDRAQKKARALPLEKVQEVADYFGVSIDYLLSLSGDGGTLDQAIDDLIAGKPRRGISIMPYGGDQLDLSELVAPGSDNATRVFVRAKDDSITKYMFSAEKLAAVQQILDAMADEKEVRF